MYFMLSAVALIAFAAANKLIITFGPNTIPSCYRPYFGKRSLPDSHGRITIEEYGNLFHVMKISYADLSTSYNGPTLRANSYILFKRFGVGSGESKFKGSSTTFNEDLRLALLSECFCFDLQPVTLTITYTLVWDPEHKPASFSALREYTHGCFIRPSTLFNTDTTNRLSRKSITFTSLNYDHKDAIDPEKYPKTVVASEPMFGILSECKTRPCILKSNLAHYYRYADIHIQGSGLGLMNSLYTARSPDSANDTYVIYKNVAPQLIFLSLFQVGIRDIADSKITLVFVDTPYLPPFDRKGLFYDSLGYGSKLTPAFEASNYHNTYTMSRFNAIQTYASFKPLHNLNELNVTPLQTHMLRYTLIKDGNTLTESQICGGEVIYLCKRQFTTSVFGTAISFRIQLIYNIRSDTDSSLLPYRWLQFDKPVPAQQSKSMTLCNIKHDSNLGLRVTFPNPTTVRSITICQKKSPSIKLDVPELYRSSSIGCGYCVTITLSSDKYAYYMNSMIIILTHNLNISQLTLSELSSSTYSPNSKDQKCCSDVHTKTIPTHATKHIPTRRYSRRSIPTRNLISSLPRISGTNRLSPSVIAIIAMPCILALLTCTLGRICDRKASMSRKCYKLIK